MGMLIGVAVLVFGVALKSLQFIGIPPERAKNERRRRTAWTLMLGGALLVLMGLALAYFYLWQTSGLNLSGRDIIELVGSLALLALLGWEVYRALVKVRASRLAGSENPKLYLAMLRGVGLLVAGYLGKLLVDYRGLKVFSSPDGIMAWALIVILVVLVLIYLRIRHDEGTGDTPKNQDPPSDGGGHLHQ
jgi:hypothetical protein